MGIVFSEQDFNKILDNRYQNYVNKKSLFSDVRPTFYEVEQTVNNLS